MVALDRLSRLIIAGCVLMGTPSLSEAKLFLGGTSTLVGGPEEFVGPLSTWINAKTGALVGGGGTICTAAAGDGIADDTTALQSCINLLGATTPVLYLPSGSYKITSTLSITALQYISLVGQQPSTTTIVWAGGSGGTMLLVNGVEYSKVDRITFNGQSIAGIAIDQSKASGVGFFDTGNEYADDVFENTTNIAFRCGAGSGGGCAETSMLRDKFLNNNAGVTMNNFNALDMCIWYSLFQNNAFGVSNDAAAGGAAGNFHVFNSVFQNSSTADIYMGNAGAFNFRNNYSTGSAMFSTRGNLNGPALVTFQGNTILDTTESLAVQDGSLGPIIFIDNIVRSALGNAGPAVSISGFGGSLSDLYSMGNTFTVSPYETATGNHHTIGDQVVSRGSVNPTAPTLPPTPPNLGRTIFEASPSGSGTTCSTGAPCTPQQAITNAVAVGNNAVAHIQVGTYNSSSTITVPANAQIQIIGDGAFSQLMWSSGAAGPVVRLQGPSLVTMRDLQIDGNTNAANGIEIDNADQPGSHVFMEQAYLFMSLTNLFVDSLDYTNVELHDFYPAYSSLVGATGPALMITGGSSAAAGLWKGGATNIFSGAATGNYVNFGITNGAHSSARAFWNDASGSQVRSADVTGISVFTYAGSELHLPSGATTAISLNNFQGTAAIVNLQTDSGDVPPQGNINITGNGTGGQVLGLGLVGPTATFFSDTSSPADTHEFLNGAAACPAGTTPPDPTPPCPNPNPGVGSAELAEIGSADPTFLGATLSQLRTTLPTLPGPLPAGVTNLYFDRVFVTNALTGIHLQH